MAKVTSKPQALRGPLERTFRQTMFKLGATFTQVISEPGAFPSTAEDLVDKGRFRASQRLTFPKPNKARFSWNTAYSIYLLKGWTTKSGTRVEGRDWISEGLKRCNISETMKQAAQQQFKNDSEGGSSGSDGGSSPGAGGGSKRRRKSKRDKSQARKKRTPKRG